VKLRVLTYNVHKCIGGVDRRYDPRRVADAIAHYEPDIVLLQEVDDRARRSNHDRQVDVLGEMLGFGYRAWYPNVKVRGGGEYGNAVLSRYPLIEERNVDLTVPPKKRRSVLHSVVRVRRDGVDRTVHVYNMHLGLAEYERRIQIRTFLDSHPFAGLHEGTPVIVGGDLNDVWGRVTGLLSPAGFRGWERRWRTFPAWAPVRGLDGIYVRGQTELLGVHRGEIDLVRRASDHRPLYADVVIHGGVHERDHAEAGVNGHEVAAAPGRPRRASSHGDGR
jgi:endonuclease/exonuclease/phosphatase family metal-dependent hydrolase